MGFSNLLEILKQVRARYPAFSKRLDEVEALARWERAVGAAIARHTRAIRVQDGVLWVEVDHPIWKSELHHRKRQILDILNNTSSMPGAQPPSPPGTPAGPTTGGPAQGSGPPPLVDLFFVDARLPGRSPR